MAACLETGKRYLNGEPKRAEVGVEVDGPGNGGGVIACTAVRNRQSLDRKRRASAYGLERERRKSEKCSTELREQLKQMFALRQPASHVVQKS